jgi:hypothetical protein
MWKCSLAFFKPALFARFIESTTAYSRAADIATKGVKDGKIQEWLDIPLVILGPPPGAQRKQ